MCREDKGYNRMIECDCGLKQKIVDEVIRLSELLPVGKKIEEFDYVDMARYNTVFYLQKLIEENK
jgi:hypothetical protein